MKRMFIVLAVLGAIMIVACLAMDAPVMVYLACLVVLVVVGFMVAPLFKQADEMLTSGAIIKRDTSFMENVQIFSLSKVSMESIGAAMKNEGLPFAGLEWKTGNDAMGFQYIDWTAQLAKLDGGDNYDIYEFGFLQWQTMQSGGIISVTQMNQLLTAVEKAFIKIDPNTKVQTIRGRITSKTSCF